MTDTTNKTTIEIVGDILERELGERWGDGYVVTDVIVGYAEPGYGDDDTVVVLGNWNPKRWVDRNDPNDVLTDEESLPSRLGDMLGEIDGVETEWLDEWYSCSDCGRAVRTEPNSYSWRPYYAWVHECEIVCADCLMKDVEGSITAGDWINNSSNALTWIDGYGLERHTDFVKWEPGNEQDYENGWHPGQDDDPRKILESILDRHPEAEVVFLIDANGQFDTHFSAWVRGIDDETDNDNKED
jgi:hypothetical protein